MTWYNIDGEVIPMEESWKLFEDAEYRRIGFDEMGDYEISTVLLMLDHNYSNEGPPLIFETMVFPVGGLKLDLLCRRYATKEEAAQGHIEALELVAKWVDDDNRWLKKLRPRIKRWTTRPI